MSQISFQYQALDATGGPAKGVIKARDRDDAYRQIVAGGMRPLKIIAKRAYSRGKKITLKDISYMTYQFSVLMEAGIPLVDGLRSIGEQEQNIRLRAVIEDVATQIEDGNSVTDALSPHREIFGEVYVETIRAAEQTGNMTKVLANLAAMLDRQYEMTKNVRSAMMYPICVVGALSLAVAFLMIFVIPRFAEMFASRGVELPLPTQFVIGISNIIRDYWYLIIAGVAAVIWGVKHAWRKPESRAKIDTWLHKIGYLNAVLRGLAISRFANVLGIALRSGVGLITALEMAGRVAGRPLLQADAEILRQKVNSGGSLSDGFLQCSYLPAFPRQMITAGEKVGELPKMCEIIARNSDREVEHLVKNVTTVIEPVLIVGLAGIVMVIALAIFLPMWNMADLIG